jgi:prevent-host-death family protein
MEKTINAVAARRRLGQLLEETYYRGNVFIIERAGRPMAAMVPIEQYRQWQQRRADFFAMIDQVQERTREVPPEELEAAIAEAIAAAKAAEKATTKPSL